MAKPQVPVGVRREVPGSSGDRERLEARRDDLEARMPDASDRDYSALLSRYLDVLDKLAALPAPVVEANPLDDLRTARARRRANPAAS